MLFPCTPDSTVGGRIMGDGQITLANVNYNSGGYNKGKLKSEKKPNTLLEKNKETAIEDENIVIPQSICKF